VRRLPIRLRGAALAFIAAAALAGLTPFASAASAQGSGCGAEGCVDVVAVEGVIDEIEADFIIRSVRAAERAGDVVAVVLQVDSPGAAVPDGRLAEVAATISESAVPVSVWIGASGAEALGGAGELVRIAAASSITPGSEIGRLGSSRLDEERFGELAGQPAEARDRTFDGEAAVEAGLVDRFDATLVDHIGNLEWVPTEVVEIDGEQRQVPVPRVRFSKLPLGTQLLHTAASPSVAYLMLVVGLGLLLFEFFTAGVGVAGLVGAGFLVLGAYGVAALPFTGWALALLLLSMPGFAVDMQTGIPRLWTTISMAAFTVGSLFLFLEFRPTWLALLVGIGGMAATVYSGMPAMIRSRFGTPTIGREWMVGEEGEVVTDVDPEGLVLIRGARWTARTNRATPVRVGDRVRVVEIDGLVLEVEPESGGAIDYREMRRGRRGESEAPAEGDPPPKTD
jgi:membrane-bound serine protease (ClpP class)